MKRTEGAVRKRLCPAATSARIALVLFASVTAIALTGRDRMAAPAPAAALEVAATSDAGTPAPTPSAPNELSSEDRGLYRMIFDAQAAKNFAQADQLMGSLHNSRLVGYVLAERYLSSEYAATSDELGQWLAHYADHPQAARIASLAARHGMDVALPKAAQPLRGEGYSDHQGRSAMPDAWYSALTFWREGNYAEAAPIFTQLSADDGLSDWQRSAAYYWAYRATDKLSDATSAQANLKQAARYGTTFYGLLASEQLGSLPSGGEAPEVADSLRNDPRAIRAALLAQLERNDDAEDELRALYSSTTKLHRAGIITLASELGLSNLQIRLARTPGISASEALFAQYPTPQYMVDLHPVMDSALLLAVARNESGFRDTAKSSAGALGMMQMLPSTARAVERRVGEKLLREASASDSAAPLAERLSNPALSARYGAEYLRMLAAEPSINRNLIHLLVGYNAGTGSVISWKAAARNVSDPLLYIESIPYAETRNYVMQVSAQYWIYQRMMDETPTSLSALARGQWPTLKASGA